MDKLKLEELRLDNFWKNRKDINTFKIYAIGFDDDTFEIGFTGVESEMSNIRINKDKFITEYISYLYKHKNYDLVKKIYLDLLKTGLLSKTYLCTKKDYIKVRSICNML